MGCDRGQVRRRRDRDPGLPAMGDDHPAARGGEVADAARFRQPADPADVRLRDGDEAAVDQLQELVPGREPLPGGELHGRAPGKLRVALEIVRPQRRLHEEQVEGLPRLEDTGGPLDRVEGVADIDHEREFGPDGRAHRCDHLGDPLVGLAQAHVRVWPVEDDLELRGAEAESPRLEDELDQGRQVLLEGRHLRHQRRVRPERLVGPLAEELPAGPAGSLAGDVPQGDVDRPEGVHARAAAAGHGRTDVEALPHRRRIEWILPDHHRAEAPIHGVRAGGLDQRPGHPRVQVCLADPDDPFVGVHLDDDRVLRRARRVRLEVGIEQNVAVDSRDPHASSGVGVVARWATIRQGIRNSRP